MRKFKNDSFSELEFLGRGTFGSVYRQNDEAIKKYHPIVKGILGDIHVNPCLRLYHLRIQRLLKRNVYIKNTDLIHDTIYINGVFSGVCSKAYKGMTLDKITSATTFKEKKIICFSLIKNAKELNQHRIYPLDYKLDNIIYTDSKQIKFIDLDDIHTKVTFFPHPFLMKKSTFFLKQSIMLFISPETYFYASQELLNMLPAYQKWKKFYDKLNVRYTEITEYLEQFFAPQKFIFISQENILRIDFQYLKEITDLEDFKIILYFRDNFSFDLDKFKNIILLFQNMGIGIFDIIIQKKDQDDLLKQYIQNYYTKEYHILINEERKQYDDKIKKLWKSF